MDRRLRFTALFNEVAMSGLDDVVSGIVCMQCLQCLISESGELNKSDCPTLCYECWKSAPKKERESGLPYFEPATGELATR